MKVGIVGAGRMGVTLARLALRAGHHVQLANRGDAEELDAVVRALGDRASGGDTSSVAHFGDLCIMATRWEQLPEAASQCGDMRNRIVVDVTNNRFGPGPYDLYPLHGLSSSEAVANLFPGALLVKAFNNQPITVLGELMHEDGTRDAALFLAGNDVAAKHVVSQFIREIGAHPVDAGSLRDGGNLMSTGTGPLAGLKRLLTYEEAKDLLERVRPSRPTRLPGSERQPLPTARGAD